MSAPDTLRMLLRCTPHCGVVKEIVDQSGRSLFASNQNSPRLHSHNSAMLRRTHWKSERITKLTAAIKPMEAAPPIAAPIAAPRLRARKDVAAKVIANTPVATA